MKPSAWFLVILMLHALFSSALASAHVSAEGHSQFEVPHLHVGKLLDSDGAFHDLPGHERGLTELASEPEHDHENIAHVHLGGEQGSTPFVVASLRSPLPGLMPSWYPDAYFGVSYQPAVPPPNV